jgi:GTP-binding protein EngB required for normal cell division
MPFQVDEDFEEPFGNLDSLDIQTDELSLDEAYALVKKIFSVTHGKSLKEVAKIKFLIKEIFDVFPRNTFQNELAFYNDMNLLADKFVEQNTIKKIHDKVVIGVGGRFSAGKSKFLNSITGSVEEEILPEDQDPSTSIPTYIIKGKRDSYKAYISGASYNLTLSQMHALSHGFKRKYGIGFSSFIDSIFIAKESFRPNEKLAFLDTPGYSKPDVNVETSKNIISDKDMAIEQLSKVDALIWLVDVDNLMDSNDIKFINSLNVRRPVLVVLNKIDRHEGDPKKIHDYINQTKKSLDESATFEVFDVVAYSSLNGKEFKGTDIIQQFLNDAVSIELNNNNILAQINSIEDQMTKEIDNFETKHKDTQNSLLNILQRSNSVTDLKAIANLLRKEKENDNRLFIGKQRFKERVESLNKKIQKMVM